MLYTYLKMYVSTIQQYILCKGIKICKGTYILCIQKTNMYTNKYKMYINLYLLNIACLYILGT
jgi:hypothetical protein